MGSPGEPVREQVMRLTTKAVAVTAMLDLALRADGGPVTLAGISEHQSISLLSGTTIRQAAPAQQSESVRRPGGGYRLARPISEITVAEIVIAVDEPLDATQCRRPQLPRQAKLHDARSVGRAEQAHL